MVDSTATIPLNFCEKHNIAPFEVQIAIEGEYKKDLTEIDTLDFTNNFHLINPVPSTSLAPPSDASAIFDQAIKEGFTDIIYPFMTTKISNQVNSARSAQKRIKDEINVHLYSTDYAAPSQAVFILYAMKMIDEGKGVKDILKFYDDVKPYIYTIGVSADFSILFRTGKVRKDVKMTIVTKLLNLKPISDIPMDKGVIGFGGGIGFKGSIKKILKQLREVSKPEIKYDMLITHSNDLDKAAYLSEAVRNQMEIGDETVWPIPPSVVCSIGKGAVMVTLYPRYEEFKLRS